MGINDHRLGDLEDAHLMGSNMREGHLLKMKMGRVGSNI